MKTKIRHSAAFLFLFLCIMFINTGQMARSQVIKVLSPDNTIAFTLTSADTLSYHVTFKGKEIISQSRLGFEFKNEEPMYGDFDITDKSYKTINETWIPVVRSKHAKVNNIYNELILKLKEKSGPMRELDFEVHAFDDGVAFRY